MSRHILIWNSIKKIFAYLIYFKIVKSYLKRFMSKETLGANSGQEVIKIVIKPLRS